MDIEYIKKIKERIDDVSKFEDSNTDGQALANMALSVGWDVLKKKIERKIYALLQPGVDGQMSLDMIGAVQLGRELAISFLQGVIADVENERKSQEALKEVEAIKEGISE